MRPIRYCACAGLVPRSSPTDRSQSARSTKFDVGVMKCHPHAHRVCQISSVTTSRARERASRWCLTFRQLLTAIDDCVNAEENVWRVARSAGVRGASSPWRVLCFLGRIRRAPSVLLFHLLLLRCRVRGSSPASCGALLLRISNDNWTSRSRTMIMDEVYESWGCAFDQRWSNPDNVESCRGQRRQRHISISDRGRCILALLINHRPQHVGRDRTRERDGDHRRLRVQSQGPDRHRRLCRSLQGQTSQSVYPWACLYCHFCQHQLIICHKLFLFNISMKPFAKVHCLRTWLCNTLILFCKTLSRF